MGWGSRGPQDQMDTTIQGTRKERQAEYSYKATSTYRDRWGLEPNTRNTVRFRTSVVCAVWDKAKRLEMCVLDRSGSAKEHEVDRSG